MGKALRPPPLLRGRQRRTDAQQEQTVKPGQAESTCDSVTPHWGSLGLRLPQGFLAAAAASSKRASAKAGTVRIGWSDHPHGWTPEVAIDWHQWRLISWPARPLGKWQRQLKGKNRKVCVCVNV